jgi:hypothetical protein
MIQVPLSFNFVILLNKKEKSISGNPLLSSEEKLGCCWQRPDTIAREAIDPRQL